MLTILNLICHPQAHHAGQGLCNGQLLAVFPCGSKGVAPAILKFLPHEGDWSQSLVSQMSSVAINLNIYTFNVLKYFILELVMSIGAASIVTGFQVLYGKWLSAHSDDFVCIERTGLGRLGITECLVYPWNGKRRFKPAQLFTYIIIVLFFLAVAAIEFSTDVEKVIANNQERRIIYNDGRLSPAKNESKALKSNVYLRARERAIDCTESNEKGLFFWPMYLDGCNKNRPQVHVVKSSCFSQNIITATDRWKSGFSGVCNRDVHFSILNQYQSILANFTSLDYEFKPKSPRVRGPLLSIITGEFTTRDSMKNGTVSCSIYGTKKRGGCLKIRGCVLTAGKYLTLARIETPPFRRRSSINTPKWKGKTQSLRIVTNSNLLELQLVSSQIFNPKALLFSAEIYDFFDANNIQVYANAAVDHNMLSAALIYATSFGEEKEGKLVLDDSDSNRVSRPVIKVFGLVIGVVITISGALTIVVEKIFSRYGPALPVRYQAALSMTTKYDSNTATYRTGRQVASMGVVHVTDDLYHLSDDVSHDFIDTDGVNVT